MMEGLYYPGDLIADKDNTTVLMIGKLHFNICKLIILMTIYSIF